MENDKRKMKAFPYISNSEDVASVAVECSSGRTSSKISSINFADISSAEIIGCADAFSLTYPFATSCAKANAIYARARRRLSMFPQKGVLIFEISDVQKSPHQH